MKRMVIFAMSIEGLVMHSNGLKKEFFNENFKHLSNHCNALKGFIEQIEQEIKTLK